MYFKRKQDKQCFGCTTTKKCNKKVFYMDRIGRGIIIYLRISL